MNKTYMSIPGFFLNLILIFFIPANNTNAGRLLKHDLPRKDSCIMDLSVNGIKIDDASSVKRIWKDVYDTGKYHWTISELDEGIFFANYNDEEYLEMKQTLSPGRGAAFNYFEVGYKKEKKNPDIYYNKSDFKDFVTESRIKLGILKKDFFKIKGNRYRYRKLKNSEKYFQYINDTKNCIYNPKMGHYSFEMWYIFKKGILVQFGFGYPVP